MPPSRPMPASDPESAASGGAFGNLGLLLQQALREQKPAAPAEEREADEAPAPVKPCADCWHAKTFRRDGVSMARCELDLWVKPVITNADLNGNIVRRWYADCPEFDDSD